MNSLTLFVRRYGLEISLCLLGGIILFLLLWFRLGSLTFGNAAAVEVATYNQSTGWRAILADPLNAPYKVLQRLLLYTGQNSLAAVRAVSTAWAVVAMALFYLVARQWHSAKVAGLATWLFITSAWFLHTARLATPEILWLVSVLALVVIFMPAKSDHRQKLLLPIQLITIGLILYVPAMIWLVLVSLVLQRKNIAAAWRSAGSTGLRLFSLLPGLLVISPLIWAFVQSPQILKAWIGLSPGSTEPASVVRRFISVPENLFILGPLDPVHWLGRLPLLGVFEILMFIVGVYFYASHLRAARARFIIILSSVAWLVIAVSETASLSLVVPAVYLFVATGIAYMLRQWLQVFPNNPIARSVGVGVIAVAVLLTSVYHTRSYFVAWRYSPETAKVFDQQL